MKKTVKVLAIVAILVATMFALTGCKKETKTDAKTSSNPIVGVWEYEYGDGDGDEHGNECGEQYAERTGNAGKCYGG